MDNVDLRKFPDSAALARAAAQDWVVWLQSAQKGRSGNQRIRVALSGGRITKDFFAEVVRQDPDPALYKNVHFFWADELTTPRDY